MNEMDEIRRDANYQVSVLARVDGRLGGFVEITTRSFTTGCHSSPAGYVDGWNVDKDLYQQECGSQLIWAAENSARKICINEIASDCKLDNLTNSIAHSALGY